MIACGVLERKRHHGHGGTTVTATTSTTRSTSAATIPVSTADRRPRSRPDLPRVRHSGPRRYPGPPMVESTLSVLQVGVAVPLIFLVLLHSGKDAGMSGAFGVGPPVAAPAAR